jgi:hypothetical protein
MTRNEVGLQSVHRFRPSRGTDARKVERLP